MKNKTEWDLSQPNPSKFEAVQRSAARTVGIMKHIENIAPIAKSRVENTITSKKKMEFRQLQSNAWIATHYQRAPRSARAHE